MAKFSLKSGREKLLVEARRLGYKGSESTKRVLLTYIRENEETGPEQFTSLAKDGSESIPETNNGGTAEVLDPHPPDDNVPDEVPVPPAVSPPVPKPIRLAAKSQLAKLTTVADRLREVYPLTLCFIDEIVKLIDDGADSVDLTDCREIECLDVALRVMADCRVESPAALNALIKIPHSVHHRRWSTVTRRTIGTVWPKDSNANGKRLKFHLWDASRRLIQSKSPAYVQAIIDEVIASEGVGSEIAISIPS